MAEFVFTYAPHGTEYGQDFDGGYTVIHCNNMSQAFDLFHAVHPRVIAHLPSFAGCYTEMDLLCRGITPEHFGNCRDHIIYANMSGGADDGSI